MVKGSILWDNVKVEDGAVVNDCILASDCELDLGLVLEIEVLEKEMLLA